MRLKWDEVTKRLFETGTDKGVIYVKDGDGNYGTGEPWNGLIGVKQSPDGAEESPIYANNKKYIGMTSKENFKGGIEAYTYPEAFAECDGSKEVVPGVYLGQQERKQFGLVYSTIIGNDTSGIDYGETIHIIYNAKVAPSERSYETVNNDPNALTLSWNFNTVPEDVATAGFKPTAYVKIDTTKVDATKLKALTDQLYGTESGEATLPSIDEVLEVFQTTSGG